MRKTGFWKSFGRALAKGAKSSVTTIGGGALAAGITIATNPEAAQAAAALIPGLAVALPWIKLIGTALAASGAVGLGTAAQDAGGEK